MSRKMKTYVVINKKTGRKIGTTKALGKNSALNYVAAKKYSVRFKDAVKAGKMPSNPLVVDISDEK